MPADWDDDGSTLNSNLRRVLAQARDDARRRAVPTVEQARRWHSEIMRGLTPPEPRYVGTFRGEAGLAGCEVAVGRHHGAPSARLAAELDAFERKLRTVVAALDARIAPGELPDREDDVAAVIDLCAWAHGEWIRIHPFANGNGRTARIWANSLAMRYGLPPFVRLRPRPAGGYGAACAAAMTGDWQPTAAVFMHDYRETIRQA